MAESNRDIKEEYYLVCEKRWVFSMLDRKSVV